MPEGDTVYVTARRLDRALAGLVVSRFDLRVTALALADFTGSVVDAVVPVGKHLLMRFSNGQTLHSHLRMDGAWRVTPTGRGAHGSLHHAVRAVIGNTQWLAVGIRVHDLRLVATSDEASLVGHLGPDLMAIDPDIAEAVRRYQQRPNQLVADALLDQTLAAGIGNVFKSELMFLHGLSPWLPVGEVTDLPGLLVDAARLLRANRSDFNRSTTGWHQPGQQYWVYGRGGKACRRCGNAVAKHDPHNVVEDRLTYYCPACQRVDRTTAYCPVQE